VVFTFKTLAGNGVFSGLFFDPPSTIGAVAPDVLSVSSPSNTDTAGTAQSFTVTALSPNGGTDAYDTGTVQFASSDSQAALPAKHTFTTADAGVYTFGNLSVAVDSPDESLMPVTQDIERKERSGWA